MSCLGCDMGTPSPESYVVTVGCCEEFDPGWIGPTAVYFSKNPPNNVCFVPFALNEEDQVTLPQGKSLLEFMEDYWAPNAKTPSMVRQANLTSSRECPVTVTCVKKDDGALSAIIPFCVTAKDGDDKWHEFRPMVKFDLRWKRVQRQEFPVVNNLFAPNRAMSVSCMLKDNGLLPRRFAQLIATHDTVRMLPKNDGAVESPASYAAALAAEIRACKKDDEPSLISLLEKHKHEHTTIGVGYIVRICSGPHEGALGFVSQIHHLAKTALVTLSCSNSEPRKMERSQLESGNITFQALLLHANFGHVEVDDRVHIRQPPSENFGTRGFIEDVTPGEDRTTYTVRSTKSGETRPFFRTEFFLQNDNEVVSFDLSRPTTPYKNMGRF